MRRIMWIAALCAALSLPVRAGIFEGSVNVDILEHTETVDETEGSVPPIVLSIYAYDELVGRYDGNRRPVVPVSPEISYGIPPWGSITGPTRGAAFLSSSIQEGKDSLPRVGKYDPAKGQIIITYDDIVGALVTGMLTGQLWVDGGTRRETNSFRIFVFFEVNEVKHKTVVYSRAALLEFDRGLDYGQLWGVAKAEVAARLNASKVRERCAYLHLMGSGVTPVGGLADGLMLAMDQFARWRSEAFITQYVWEDGRGRPAIKAGEAAPSLRMLVHYFRPEDVNIMTDENGQLVGDNVRPQFWTIPGSGLEWHTFNSGDEPTPPSFLRDRVAGLMPVALVDTNCYPNVSTFLVHQGDIGFLPESAPFGVLATNEGGMGWWRIDSPGGALCFYNVVKDINGLPIAQTGYRQYTVVPGGAPETGLSPLGLGCVTGRVNGQVEGGARTGTSKPDQSGGGDQSGDQKEQDEIELDLP